MWRIQFRRRLQMDRISGLPDDILCHMLSFLPTKYAVASSILSTRWRYMWTSVPILDFDSRLHRDYYPVFDLNAYRKSETTFQTFVSKVLLHKDMPYIQKLRFIYECHRKSGTRTAPIPTWFHGVISDNIQELELDFCLSIRGNVADLPRKVFTSSILVVLKLSRMPLKVPSSVCLPNLKVLELRKIIFLNDNCIQNLLSGCHVLEELAIEEIARDKQKVVDICIHTLRSFWFSYKYVIDILVDHPYKFIINAPNLEYFHVKGRITDVFEVRNLSALNNASVDLRRTVLSTLDYIVCHQRIFDLLEGISNAKSITFSGEVVQVLCEAVNRSPPRFSNLTRLAFGIGLDFCWKRILTEFIKCSPYLEVVMLNNKQGLSRDVEELSKFPLQPLPVNLRFHLKNILIDELYANFMPEFVEHLVQHFNVLKRLEIICHCPNMLSSQIGLTS